MEQARLIEITGIYEKYYMAKKEDAQYRVGRIGWLCILEENCRCVVVYTTSGLAGKVLSTSIVERWTEDEKGISVVTQNSIYRFEFRDELVGVRERSYLC